MFQLNYADVNGETTFTVYAVPCVIEVGALKCYASPLPDGRVKITIKRSEIIVHVLILEAK